MDAYRTGLACPQTKRVASIHRLPPLTVLGNTAATGIRIRWTTKVVGAHWSAHGASTNERNDRRVIVTTAMLPCFDPHVTPRLVANGPRLAALQLTSEPVRNVAVKPLWQVERTAIEEALAL